MKKRKKIKRFSRTTDQRKAFLKALSVALITKEKIKTTEVRAKEVSSFLSKFVTKAKKADLSSIRSISEIFSKRTSKKLIEKIAPMYKDRKGGYFRITKLGQRKSDGAKMAIIEFVK